MIYFEMLLCLVFDIRVCFVRCIRCGRSVTTRTKNSVSHHRASSRITGTNSRTVRSSCRSVALYPIPDCVHPTPFLAVSTLPHSWLCQPYPIPGRVHSTPFLAVSTLPHSWLCPPYPIPGRVHPTPFLAVSTLPHSLPPQSSGIAAFRCFIMLFLEIGDVQHFLNMAL